MLTLLGLHRVYELASCKMVLREHGYTVSALFSSVSPKQSSSTLCLLNHSPTN